MSYKYFNSKMFLRWSTIVALFVFSLTCHGMPDPDADSDRIAAAAGKILNKDHFESRQLNERISQKFLKNYLESLDPTHLFFLQSDIQEFERKFGTTLDDETLSGNLEPAVEIFKCYLQRVEQRVALVKELLKEKFLFDSPESMLINREEEPWPANEMEVRKLWNQRVKFELLQEHLNDKPTSEPEKVVSRRYDRFLSNMQDFDTETLLQVYLTSLANAYDPHSEYLPASEFENFGITMKLSMEGIGVVLTSEDGYTKVVEIVPGGPAALDKRLKVNDRIVAVAQQDGSMVDVVNMRLIKIVKLIRGSPNTKVRLLVWPASASDPAVREEITLKRDKIQLTEQEAKAKVIHWKDGHGKNHQLGCINLPSFYMDLKKGLNSKSATHDVEQLLDKLKAEKVEGLMLDLRGNKGGSLDEAVALTGLFISQGPIVQIKDRSGQIGILNDQDPAEFYNGPLVVLVDHLSASASEILAGALQDYGRAVIVGDQSTFGKGTVQKIQDLGRTLSLKNAGALKVTIQKFYRVSGGSTQYRGIIPDIRLPSLLDIAKINESSLKNPLPYDEIYPANYVPVNRVAGFLKKLSDRSAQRVADNPEFKYIRQDIARLEIQLKKKDISLNEKQRLGEIQADAQREQIRNDERSKREKKSFDVAEISLDSMSKENPNETILSSKTSNGTNTRPADKSELARDQANQAVFEESLQILEDLVELSPKH